MSFIVFGNNTSLFGINFLQKNIKLIGVEV